MNQSRKNVSNNLKQKKKGSGSRKTGQKFGIHTGFQRINQGDTLITIPKSVGTFMPDRLKTTLRFWKSQAIPLTSLTYGSVRFSPSAAFDMDPTVGSATAAGFNELAAIYSSYRVTESSALAEIVNTGDSPCVGTLLPTNLDPGASPVANWVISSREQPYAVSKTGSLAGGPVCRLTQSMTTQKLFGNPMTKYDDNFAALVTAIPVNNWYWVVTLYVLAVSPQAIIVNFYMEVEIDFYDRRVALKA
jgi:hypothetical protein